MVTLKNKRISGRLGEAMKQIYICEDTITGIYSALHDAWKECRDTQAGVELRGRTQRQLFCEYRIVEESEEKALRLERMIKHHLGYNAYWEIYHALLSTDDRKGTVVFEVLQEARKIRQSEKIMEHLGCPAVADVFSMSRSVSNEAHRYEEFIRFRELENGILFSEITPKAQILTCVADHFEDRFPLENWIIYDKTHKVCLVHGVRKRWRLVWGELFNERAAENISEEVSKFQEFYDDGIKDIGAFIGVSKETALENGEIYRPSNGERGILLMQKLLDSESDVYILDEPELGMGNSYITSNILPKLTDLAKRRKTVIIATHNANIAVGTLPYISILRTHENGIYKTYVGNPFYDELRNIDDETDTKNWTQESMHTLEGGKTAFYDRKDIYESGKQSD